MTQGPHHPQDPDDLPGGSRPRPPADQAQAPADPARADQARPPADRPPRRSAALRAATAAGVLLPLCLAGWLGWQAYGGHTAGHPDGAAPGGVAAAASAAAATNAAPAAAPPGGTSPVPAPSAPGTPSAAAPTGGAAPAASATPGTTASGSAAATPGAGTAGVSLAGRTVLLDPGHNPGNSSHTAEINRQVDIGNARKECDATGTSTNAGYSEAAFSLDVVRRARTILQARGATVVLTHDGDRPWGPCIDERARAGGAAHADAAVSVHGDGGPSSGSGFHVIMPARVAVPGRTDNSAIVAPSRRLGLLLRDGFREATGEPAADYVAAQGLDTRADLGGLNLSTVPKVFIECGNMRNPVDAKRMTDPQWRQQAAQGIADALTAFLAAPGGTTTG